MDYKKLEIKNDFINSSIELLTYKCATQRKLIQFKLLTK